MIQMKFASKKVFGFLIFLSYQSSAFAQVPFYQLFFSSGPVQQEIEKQPEPVQDIPQQQVVFFVQPAPPPVREVVYPTHRNIRLQAFSENDQAQVIRGIDEFSLYNITYSTSPNSWTIRPFNEFMSRVTKLKFNPAPEYLGTTDMKGLIELHPKGISEEFQPLPALLNHEMAHSIFGVHTCGLSADSSIDSTYGADAIYSIKLYQDTSLDVSKRYKSQAWALYIADQRSCGNPQMIKTIKEQAFAKLPRS